MDLKKAKMILITFFFIINIFLLSMIIFSGNDNRVERSILNDVHELFEDSGKKIDCEIPDDIRPLPQMEMVGDINIGNTEGTEFTSEGLGFTVDGYVLLHDFGDRKVYVERYKGYMVFENRVEIYGDHMAYSNREITGFDSGLKKIIPAYTVLLKEYLNSDIEEIEDIQLIYMKYADEEIVGPVWFIAADGTARYFYAFEAFNGIEVK